MGLAILLGGAVAGAGRWARAGLFGVAGGVGGRGGGAEGAAAILACRGTVSAAAAARPWAGGGSGCVLPFGSVAVFVDGQSAFHLPPAMFGGGGGQIARAGSRTPRAGADSAEATRSVSSSTRAPAAVRRSARATSGASWARWLGLSRPFPGLLAAPRGPSWLQSTAVPSAISVAVAGLRGGFAPRLRLRGVQLFMT